MIWIAIVTGVSLAGAALITWLRHRFVVIDVDGPSMEPTLYAGDRVLVRRQRLRHIRAGDIVVVAHPQHHQASRHRPAAGRPWMIKRAAAVPGDPVPASLAATVSAAAGTHVPGGRLLVLGDNTGRSFDSRSWGYFSEDGVLGVVIRPLPTVPVVLRGRGRH